MCSAQSGRRQFRSIGRPSRHIHPRRERAESRIGTRFQRNVTLERGPRIRSTAVGVSGHVGHQTNSGERSKMSTMTATQATSTGMTKDERFVILASSLGTVFEWYDFYLYGSLASIIGAQFFSAYPTGDARYLCAAGICRGLPGASVRRDRVRPHRRYRRPQVHLPRHHPDHGSVDVHRRSFAQRGYDRLRRAGDPDRAASGAGPRARRRIWRRSHLRGRTRPERQARLLHLVYPDHRHPRPVPVAAGDPVHPHRDRRGRFRGLGLAHSVPGLRAAARRLGLDPSAPQSNRRSSRR